MIIPKNTIHNFASAATKQALPNTGETRLFIGIIKQAITDLDELLEKAENNVYWNFDANRLLKWFNSTNEKTSSLQWTCDVLNISARTIRTELEPKLHLLNKIRLQYRLSNKPK